MIRVVPTGDLGLDVLTGGGWRLVKRYEDRESASVLVRGGAGAGKTLVGLQVALELARELGGDVAVGGVEILPTEYIAQLHSARPSLDAARVVQLPAHVGTAEGPRVFVGLMTSLDPEAPDLVTNLEALSTAVETAGGKPAVFLVDSLIDGYGIGSSISRIEADSVIKFAVHGGYGLVLCEETVTDAASPWVFAADTVLQLGVDARERGRWIEVRKHRFGPSATGRHELDVAGVEGPSVFPEPHAWMSQGIRSTLVAHGWKFSSDRRPIVMTWPSEFQPKSNPVEGNFALIAGDEVDSPRTLASTLRPLQERSPVALVIELDPVARVFRRHSGNTCEFLFLPTTRGANRALREVLERFALGLSAQRSPRIGRVIVGDLGVVLNAADASTWTDAVLVLVSLVVESGWSIPVIVYDGRHRIGGEARFRLATYADVVVDVAVGAKTVVSSRERWKRQPQEWSWPAPLVPSEGTFLDQMPRARSPEEAEPLSKDVF